MGNDFQIVLQAILDTSGIGKNEIAKVQQIIDRYRVNLDIKANTGELLKNVKSALSEINKSLDSEHQIKINDNDISKAIQQTDKLTEAMARGREKSEELRKSEQQRQQLAQNKTINKSLESEYNLREKNRIATERQNKLDLEKAKNFAKSSSQKIKDAMSKYSYGNSSDAQSLMQELNKGMSNFKFDSNGNISNVSKTITQYEARIKSVLDTLKQTHNNNLSSINKEISEETKLQSQKDAFNQKNLNAIDLEIKKREESAKMFSNSLKAQMIENQKKLQNSNTISSKLDVGDYKTQITTLQSSLEKWGMSADETKAKMASLKTAYTELQNAKTVDERISAEQKFQTVLKTTQNEVAELKATMASPVKVTDTYNKITTTLKNNSAMSKEAKKSLQEYQATLKNGNVSASGLQNIENGYKNVIVQERVAGRLGNNFIDTIKSGAKSIAQWSISMYGVASAMQGLRSGIENLKEVDNILTEISKTSNSTAAQLKEIGNESYDVASKYGVKNTAYLTGVQEMNRSGFYGKQGQAMAEQSILAQSAGDMEEEIADKWVLATNAAYKYQGQAEKINAVLDGTNEINTMVSFAW